MIPIIVPGLILVFLLIVLAFIMVLKAETKEKSSVFGGLEMVLFLVMMPKNQTKKEGENQKEEKNLISQMEQVFANFLYFERAIFTAKTIGIIPLFSAGSDLAI